MRFRDNINNVCFNRKCQLAELHLGPMLGLQITEYINADKIAVLNLSKNSLCDQGIFHLMKVVKYNKSLVSLNVSSNEISGIGFGFIFDAMSVNESIISLNLATIEGVNRNRMTKQSAEMLKAMLIQNKFLEILNISCINLGDDGLRHLTDAFMHGIEGQMELEKAKEREGGKFIRSDAHK